MRSLCPFLFSIIASDTHPNRATSHKLRPSTLPLLRLPTKRCIHKYISKIEPPSIYLFPSHPAIRRRSGEIRRLTLARHLLSQTEEFLHLRHIRTRTQTLENQPMPIDKTPGRRMLPILGSPTGCCIRFRAAKVHAMLAVAGLIFVFEADYPFSADLIFPIPHEIGRHNHTAYPTPRQTGLPCMQLFCPPSQN
jgi:hypothetical protein